MFKGRWQGRRKEENWAALGDCWIKASGEKERGIPGLPSLCLRCKSGAFRNAQKKKKEKASVRT